MFCENIIASTLSSLIEISNNGGITWEGASNNVLITFQHFATCYNIIPQTQIVNMISTITIVGSNFIPLNNHSYCSYNNTKYRKATVINTTLAMCPFPIFNSVGSNISVSLFLNGKNEIPCIQSIKMMPQIFIESIFPTFGPIQGGTIVTVTGYNFNFTNGCCKFGNMISNANVSNSTIVLCTAPQHWRKQVFLEISPDCIHYTEFRHNFYFYNLPTLTAISPTIASANVANEIMLQGTNFLLLSNAKVWMQSTYITPTVFSNTLMKFMTPNLFAGTQLVACSNTKYFL